MPTHEDFPDSYFDDPDYWDLSPAPRPSPARGIPLQIKVFGVFVLLVAAFAFGRPLWSDLFSHARSPTARPAATSPTTAPRRPAPAAAGVAAGRPFAVGTSLPADGRPPHLTATARGGPNAVAVTVRSSSPALVAIYVSPRPGQRVKLWRRLRAGEPMAQAVITGRRYGYCFEQASTSGYAATRACGTLITHQSLNGVRLPNGAPAVTEFTFVRR